MEAVEINVVDVVFREDLYPRIEHSPVTVQQYAADLDVLPPIEVNQHNELIDGWHRWTAHKKNGADKIKAVITETKGDGELLLLAAERNSKFGLQLSRDDKRDVARKVYNGTPESQRDGVKARLKLALSVSLSSIHEWLSRIDKDTKSRRDQRILDMWMACHTQEEIADAVNCHQTVVGDILREIPKSEIPLKPEAQHITDFDAPLYNVWKQQTKTAGSGHFGNSEIRWVDNLLYLYTQPFDVVVDPFAGGGSTIDLCKKRFRRYWVSDRKPVVEREKEIRQHDITDGLPPLPRWKDVKLVYLDPPYWAQAASEYSEDPTDLANMPLDEFTTRLSTTINDFGKKLASGAVIALILQPTQWRAPERQYTDHVADMIKAVKLPIDLRIQCPYESQQCTPQMVEWAKANRKVLVLSREIVVWRVA